MRMSPTHEISCLKNAAKLNTWTSWTSHWPEYGPWTPCLGKTQAQAPACPGIACHPKSLQPRDSLTSHHYVRSNSTGMSPISARNIAVYPAVLELRRSFLESLFIRITSVAKHAKNAIIRDDAQKYRTCLRQIFSNLVAGRS